MASCTLTRDIDYTAIGDATAEMADGTLTVSPLKSGDGVLFYNVFGQENCLADVGVARVEMTLKNNGGAEAGSWPEKGH